MAETSGADAAGKPREEIVDVDEVKPEIGQEPKRKYDWDPGDWKETTFANILASREIHRGVAMEKMLAGRGALLHEAHKGAPRSGGKESWYRLSTELDAKTPLYGFVSHAWSSSPTRKHLSLAMEWYCASATCWWFLLVAACIGALIALRPTAQSTVISSEALTIIAVVFPPIAAAIHFCFIYFGHVFPSRSCCKADDMLFFLDVCVINQMGADKLRHGVDHLEAFCCVSKKIFMLADDTYLTRLWCVFEVATLCKACKNRAMVEYDLDVKKSKANPVKDDEDEAKEIMSVEERTRRAIRKRLIYVPLRAGALKLAMTMCVDMILVYAAVGAALSGTTLAIDVVLFYGISLGLCFVALCVSAYTFTVHRRQSNKLLSQLRNFRVENAQCYMDDDRRYIMAFIEAQFAQKGGDGIGIFEQFVQVDVAGEMEKRWLSCGSFMSVCFGASVFGFLAMIVLAFLALGGMVEGDEDGGDADGDGGDGGD